MVMKRIVAAFLALTIGISMAFAAPIPDVDNERFVRVLNVLDSLGILYDVQSGGNFRPDDSISRGEAVSEIIKIAGINVPQTGKKVFSDVAEDSEFFAAVSAAVEEKIIVGYTQDVFHPEKNAQSQEVVRMLLCAMGYYQQSEILGGYPQGYLNTASNIGLTKNISASGTAEITRKDFAFLLYNALTLPLFTITMEQGGIGMEQDNEHTLLSDRHQAFIEEGLLNANSVTTLYEVQGVGEGYVSIGDKILSVGDTDAEALIGQYVEYCAYEDEYGEEVLLGIWVKDADSVVVLKSEGILEETTLDTIYYLENEDDSREKRYRLIENADLIYNTQAAPLDDVSRLMPALGSVTLSDIDADGRYDIVIVDSYELQIVEQAYAQSERILFKNDLGTLNLEEDYADYQILLDGEEKTLADLVEWDVLEIRRPPNPEEGTCIIRVCKMQVGGVLQGKSDEKVFIDGAEYEIAREYPSMNLAQAITGQQVVVLLDSAGRAVEIQSFLASELCGFLYRIVMDETEDEKAYVKIFTENGEWVNAYIDQKAKFNGERTITHLIFEELQCRGDANGVKINDQGMMVDVFGRYIDYQNSERNSFKTVTNGVMGQQPYKQITDRKLILFQMTSDKKITSIRTPDGDRSANRFMMIGSYLEAPGLQWREAIRAFFINNWGAAVYPVFYGDENCKMFQIPFDQPDAEDLYNIKLGNSLAHNDFHCYAQTFGFREDKIYDDVPYVLLDANTDDSRLTNVFLVTKVTDMLDEDEMVVTKLCGYEDGLYKEYIIEDREVLRKPSGSYLQFGDLLDFYLNSDNTIRVMYKLADGDIYFDTDQEKADQLGSVGYFRDGRTKICGYVDGVNAKQNRFSLVNGTYNEDGRNPSFGLWRTWTVSEVYVLDCKTNDVRLGNIADLEIGDFVSVIMAGSAIAAVVVYRNL
ncbi:MAG: hypothetical protein E7397_06145 [Ruminococcaceae bacterium]|nr:hypothetical protein [Oscillospiraceae bacterium]